MEEISEKAHKASTHSPRDLVRPDVAAVEVDVAISDVDATSLRVEQWSVQRGAGQRTTAVWGAKELTFCESSMEAACMPREKRNGQSIRAMEEVSWKVQNASTYSYTLLNKERMEV